ncbi:helix-turn-helix domain-containing protein [Flavobacterium haoranii]|uniref:Helix-turn-helix n=1 Tax=Flavobacterium haoranii TaxID=683124 RepID=A0A1M6I0R3_9FLAO|nr:helix-turn-helix transcriptional regulator [Flavobacterium haoranii]SHJ28082.1 Helix-turn-helix [Flavobacterium haoranii]
MINTDDFIKRLEAIFEFYGLSASTFADKIGVQRSSLSHLLSGRNKPSLDFILKVDEVFEEVDLYWLLNGTGTFPKSEKKITEAIKEVEKNSNDVLRENLKINDNFSQDLFSEVSEASTSTPIEKITNELITEKKISETIIESDIDYIVIFFKNGKFKKYTP